MYPMHNASRKDLLTGAYKFREPVQRSVNLPLGTCSNQNFLIRMCCFCDKMSWYSMVDIRNIVIMPGKCLRKKELLFIGNRVASQFNYNGSVRYKRIGCH